VLAAKPVCLLGGCADPIVEWESRLSAARYLGASVPL